MDYNVLLDLAADLGYQLAMSGAETFRVEESISYVLSSYGVEAESFAIPNYLIVSIKDTQGQTLTRMRRIGTHGNDLDSVERYSNLSRRICAEHPSPKEALQWLQETDRSRVQYSTFVLLIGHFLGACGYAVFFGSSFIDALFAGICGIVVGVVTICMERLNANQFFRIMISSFLMALLAYVLSTIHLISNADTVIIGTLMILVPGLLFTNAMRDIIYGDTNSGMNRIIHVFLIAVAISLGTATAWNTTAQLFSAPVSLSTVPHSIPVQLLSCYIGCYGFVIIFNIHGPGGLLCNLGGAITWGAYVLSLHISGDDITAYLFATIAAATYSEIMARIRKYPAISYLVVSIFPLIPGASIYYTMMHAILGQMDQFAARGMHTIAIAGAMAIGILLVSTTFRILSSAKAKPNFRKT